MKSFIVAQLAAYALALGLGDKDGEADTGKLTGISDPADCARLESSFIYHYEFNGDACACFFKFDIEYDAHCGPDEHFNVLHIPYTDSPYCISNYEYKAIF